MKTFNGYKAAYQFLVTHKYAAPNRRKPLGTTKFYQDIRRGLFPVQDKDTITEEEILSYAHRVGLIRLDKNATRLDSLLEEEKRTKIELLEIRKKREKLNAEKEAGRYIQKNKWLVELVSKLSASKFAALQVARARSAELITAVGGDLKKEGLFVELFTEWIEQAFDELAQVPELKCHNSSEV